MGLATFLNGREPARLRGLAWLALSDVAVIQARTSTSDSGGGASLSWAAAGTVACRIDPLGGGVSRIVGGEVNEQSTHICTMPPGTPVDLRDRIVVQAGGTFEVTLVRERTGELSKVCEVMQVDPL